MSLWSTDAGAGALAGVRVVDFGQYIAGPMAAMLLADQGADVIRVDPPGGPRWHSPANAALLRGRRRVVLDLTSEADRERAVKLVASADVVIENFRPGVMDRLGLGPGRFTRIAPQLIFCSMPGFAADDERAGVPAWEGVVMAAGGGYSLTGLRIGGSTTADSPAAFSPAPLASVFAALETAMAVGAALIARDRDGRGQRIEVPLFDALFEASGVQGMSLERSPLRGTSFGSGLFRCADGRHLTFVAQWFRHLVWFVEAAGRQDWIDEGLVDLDRLRADPEAAAELHCRLTDLFSTRDALEWERLGREHGCSLAMVRSTAEFAAEPAATESGALARVVDPLLGEILVPGIAVDLTRSAGRIAPRTAAGADTATVVASLDALPQADAAPEPAPEPAHEPAHATRRPPLDGIRVLDLSRVVAAPTTGKLLAQLGADVVKLDVDPAGSTAAFEEPLFHVHLNRGKQTVIADLFTEEGRSVFADLVASCDILVQNFTLGTAERLGTSDEQVRKLAPEIVNLYLNAFGTRGPWAGHRGYAELANVSSGLSHFTLGDGMPPSGSSPSIDFPRWIFTDYATGVLGAFGAILGLLDRTRTNRGQLVETSLLRATALEQIPWIVGDPDAAIARSSGRSATGWDALQRLYATADGWLFLGAAPSQTARVRAALGLEPDTALGLEPESEPDTAPVDLESELEARLARLRADEACRALHAAGIGAHEVTSLPDLMREGGPADRRGLRASDRSPRHGEVVMPGPVVRFSETPMRAGTLPAEFGTDFDAVLTRAAR